MAPDKPFDETDSQQRVGLRLRGDAFGGDNPLSVSAGCQQARAVFSRQSVGSAGRRGQQATGRGTKPHGETQSDKPREIHCTPLKVTTNQQAMGKKMEIGPCSVQYS